MTNNLEAHLKFMSSIAQQTRVQEQGQFSLGMLIEAVEKCENNENVAYDFGYMCPTYIDSWRGSYEELALNYESCKSEEKEMKRDDFVKMLKDAVGKTFEGYKGGDFTMNENTPVWVSNYGEACDTAVTGVLDLGWKIIIQTTYLKY